MQSERNQTETYSQFREQKFDLHKKKGIGRAKRSSDQNVLRTLYSGNGEVVLSLLKTHFVRIFSSSDHPSSALFALGGSSAPPAVPLSHHLLELLRSQQIDIFILNNHQLVDGNVLKEYGNVISTTSDLDQFDVLSKGNDSSIGNPFYVDFVLKRSAQISSNDSMSQRLYLGIFELEKLLFQVLSF